MTLLPLLSRGLLVYVPVSIRLLTVVLALVVVVKAIRGYRQNDSQPMLLLAAGLVLLVLVAPLVRVAGEVLAGPISGGAGTRGPASFETAMAVLAAEQLVQLAGVATILGSLYVRR